MQSKSLRVVLKGLLCFGLLIESPLLQGYSNRLVRASFASGILATVSLINGVCNVRRDNQVMSQCELDYGLLPEIHWLQYPSQFVQNLLCMNVDDLEMRDRVNHGSCMSEVRRKINLFDSMDIQTIWNFEKYKDVFPHTDFQSAYCVSKSYLGSFGYQTLGDLKSAVTYQILKSEDDFKKLINITDLPWFYTKMPKNLDEFYELKYKLSTCYNYHGAYACLGICGYSCVHNAQRVKDCLIPLVKIHAFLINFQELLKTCVDGDETRLINSQGLLNFSLQHVHYVKKKL